MTRNPRRIPWRVCLSTILVLVLLVIVSRPETVPADSGRIEFVATGSPSTDVIHRPSPDGQPASGVSPVAFEHRAMSYAAYHAGSRIRDVLALGGFGPSANFAHAITTSQANSMDALYLLAEPDHALPSGHMRLLLVNATSMNVAFEACDSKLAIVQEALDDDGQWKPVEYNTASGCGNSYHRVFLGPDQFWEFAAPYYTGPFKTRLRFRLTLPNEKSVYSNEFVGGLFKSQFIAPLGVRQWP